MPFSITLQTSHALLFEKKELEDVHLEKSPFEATLSTHQKGKEMRQQNELNDKRKIIKIGGVGKLKLV